MLGIYKIWELYSIQQFDNCENENDLFQQYAKQSFEVFISAKDQLIIQLSETLKVIAL